MRYKSCLCVSNPLLKSLVYVLLSESIVCASIILRGDTVTALVYSCSGEQSDHTNDGKDDSRFRPVH